MKADVAPRVAGLRGLMFTDLADSLQTLFCGEQGRRHRGGSGGSRPPSCQPGPFIQNLQERKFGDKK